MKEKSVLTFYYAENAYEDNFDYKWVFNRIVTKQADGIRCINVYHCDMSVTKLASWIKNLSADDHGLLESIKLEQECGAIFMFVAPVVGEPIAGYLIEEFLAMYSVDRKVLTNSI